MRSLDEAKAFVAAEFARDEFGECSHTVTLEGGVFTIKVERMYEFVDLNFARLCRVSEFFGTKQINDSRYSSEGCETCDYGSRYEITLTVSPEVTQ